MALGEAWQGKARQSKARHCIPSGGCISSSPLQNTQGQEEKRLLPWPIEYSKPAGKIGGNFRCFSFLCLLTFSFSGLAWEYSVYVLMHVVESWGVVPIHPIDQSNLVVASRCVARGPWMIYLQGTVEQALAREKLRRNLFFFCVPLSFK